MTLANYFLLSVPQFSSWWNLLKWFLFYLSLRITVTTPVETVLQTVTECCLSFGSSSPVGRTTGGLLQCLGTAVPPCSCQVKSWKASLLGETYSFFVSSVPYGGKRHDQGVRWLSGSRRLPSSLGPLEFNYLVPAWGKERTDCRKLSSDHHVLWHAHPFRNTNKNAKWKN